MGDFEKEVEKPRSLRGVQNLLDFPFFIACKALVGLYSTEFTHKTSRLLKKSPAELADEQMNNQIPCLVRI